MKRAIMVMMAMASVILVSKGALPGAIKGGLIDTQKSEIAMVEEIAVNKFIYAEALAQSVNRDGMGKLILVYPYNRVVIARSAFRDKYWVNIAPPTDNFDKIVYIDRLGAIRGAIGLMQGEFDALMTKRPTTFGKARALHEIVGRMVGEKLGAVRSATAAFGLDMTEDEQFSYFKTTIEMLVGKAFADAVNGVIECAAVGEEASLVGRTVDGLTPLALGVYLVAEGDNGGFGLVAEGDNGGFGTVNPIAEGDNGGFGLVAEGDNGGFGSVVIVQGWAMDPDIPPLPDMDLNLAGTMMFLME